MDGFCDRLRGVGGCGQGGRGFRGCGLGILRKERDGGQDGDGEDNQSFHIGGDSD